MTNLGNFLKYVIDPRKVKALILVLQSVILLMLVGCRNQLEKDTTRFQAEIEALQATHEAEIARLTAQAEQGIYATQYLSSEYKDDAWALGQWLDCLDQRYSLTPEAKALACWVVLNRMESSEYPDSIEEVLLQPGQFCEFSDKEEPTEANFIIATNQLSRYHNGDIRPVPSTAIFITVNNNGVELRNDFKETARTQYWRAK